MPHLLRILAGVILLASLVGCAGPSDATRQGSPQVQLTNARGRPLPPTIRRVLALPLHNPQVAGETQHELDAVFESELNKHQRFEIVRVTRAELSTLTQREEISSVEAFPTEALSRLQQRYAPDAILLTDITSYRPYKPISMGVRSRLLDSRSLSELWAVDATLDSANEEVVRAATYEAGNGPQAGLVLQSPRKFAGFVFQQVFSTLPPR